MYQYIELNFIFFWVNSIQMPHLVGLLAFRANHLIFKIIFAQSHWKIIFQLGDFGLLIDRFYVIYGQGDEILVSPLFYTDKTSKLSASISS